MHTRVTLVVAALFIDERVLQKLSNDPHVVDMVVRLGAVKVNGDTEHVIAVQIFPVEPDRVLGLREMQVVQELERLIRAPLARD